MAEPEDLAAARLPWWHPRRAMVSELAAEIVTQRGQLAGKTAELARVATESAAADAMARDADALRAETEAILARTREALERARAELAARPKPEPEPEAPTRAEAEHLHSLFTPSPPDRPCAVCGKAHPGPCEACGGIHARKCPRVREIEYEIHGDKPMIKRVVYWREWDREGILFPEDLPEIPAGDTP